MLYPPELLLEQSLLQGHGMPPGLDKEAEMIAKTLDTLMGGDFQQYRANVYCQRPDCPHASTFACGYEPQCIHSKKQTHYHCLQCGFAVLGLSQMTSHKYKHQEANLGPSTSSTN
ncbi:hypothetical protein MSG28_011456 [Choristoneura fumiferana]|uniref:Uncharacterized protein n=1 Tax=Choristoneura fumiferana TaxID=7141 RepID=A0ACC0JNH8_CHOFU|nr:hypothetical protein MSG28_011456 [Choristoneura fumiferana]